MKLERNEVASRLKAKVTATRVVFCGATFSIAIGLLVIAAWLRGATQWLHRGPDDTVMYCDAALLCILAGLGFLAALREMFGISRAIGIALAILGNLHFSADLGGFSMSMHNIFRQTSASVLSESQMRLIQIAPATAVSFMLLGCGLALLSKRTSNHVLGAMAGLGFVTSGIGMIGLFGCPEQIIGLTRPHVFSCMATPTAICIFVLGITLCGKAVRASQWKRYELSASVAAMAVIVLVLVFGGIDAAVFVNTTPAAAKPANPSIPVCAFERFSGCPTFCF